MTEELGLPTGVVANENDYQMLPAFPDDDATMELDITTMCQGILDGIYGGFMLTGKAPYAEDCYIDCDSSEASSGHPLITIEYVAPCHDPQCSVCFDTWSVDEYCGTC